MRKLNRRAVYAKVVPAIFLMTTPSMAFSGAQFLETTADFADGYAWGVLEARVLIDPGSDELRIEQRQIWECINTASVTSHTFADGVRSVINSDPQYLTNPALSAILKTLNRMCLDR